MDGRHTQSDGKSSHGLLQKENDYLSFLTMIKLGNVFFSEPMLNQFLALFGKTTTMYCRKQDQANKNFGIFYLEKNIKYLSILTTR